jgi:hypothetical protein
MVAAPAAASSSVSVASPSAATPPAAAGAGPNVGPGGLLAAAGIKMPPPAAAARPGGSVARFIPAEAAQSKLKPADDGKLPGLRLHETAGGARPEKARGANPLVLLGLLCLSVVMTVVILFSDLQPNDRSSDTDKADARWQISENYFADLGNQALKPYQVYLRNAQQAHVRGNIKTERAMYHKVLGLLRAERLPSESLTGTLQRDKELENYLITLLR